MTLWGRLGRLFAGNDDNSVQRVRVATERAEAASERADHATEEMDRVTTRLTDDLDMFTARRHR